MLPEFHTIRIGKNGITAGILTEIQRELKRHKTVKVKFLSSFMQDKDKKRICQELADTVDATVAKRVGFSVVLKKK